MSVKKICLFTAHSPSTGGGSVIIKSLIENLDDIAFCWKYISNEVAPGYEEGYLGKGFMGSNIINDVFKTRQMLLEKSCESISKLVSQLLKIECDGYWIVSHNEGLRIAIELTKVQKARPVHLTIHDDWAGAICSRSSRYGLLKGLAQKLTATALQKVSTFDVISRGMQIYYKDLCGREGMLCHRYLKNSSIHNSEVTGLNSNTEIRAGHIGSIYNKEDFFKFLDLFQEFVRLRNQIPVLHMWGCHLSVHDIPANVRDVVRFHDGLPEANVIPELLCCSFVYSMYPMADKYQIFSKTSLPTKLSSYAQAARPIFGHGSADSTLAEFIGSTGTGVLWSSNEKNEGMKAFSDVLLLRPSQRQWQLAREKYFGEKNLVTMRKVLCN